MPRPTLIELMEYSRKGHAWAGRYGQGPLDFMWNKVRKLGFSNNWSEPLVNFKFVPQRSKQDKRQVIGDVISGQA